MAGDIVEILIHAQFSSLNCMILYLKSFGVKSPYVYKTLSPKYARLFSCIKCSTYNHQFENYMSVLRIYAFSWFTCTSFIDKNMLCGHFKQRKTCLHYKVHWSWIFIPISMLAAYIVWLYYRHVQSTKYLIILTKNDYKICVILHSNRNDEIFLLMGHHKMWIQIHQRLLLTYW